MADIETVDRTIQERRSSRAFTAQPVPRELIEELLNVARWAPSGSNSQPWRVTVASGPVAEDLRQRLREAATAMTPQQSESYRQRIASGPMAWILDCVEEPIDQYLTVRSMTFATLRRLSLSATRARPTPLCPPGCPPLSRRSCWRRRRAASAPSGLAGPWAVQRSYGRR